MAAASVCEPFTEDKFSDERNILHPSIAYNPGYVVPPRDARIQNISTLLQQVGCFVVNGLLLKQFTYRELNFRNELNFTLVLREPTSPRSPDTRPLGSTSPTDHFIQPAGPNVIRAFLYPSYKPNVSISHTQTSGPNTPRLAQLTRSNDQCILILIIREQNSSRYTQMTGPNFTKYDYTDPIEPDVTSFHVISKQ